MLDRLTSDFPSLPDAACTTTSDPDRFFATEPNRIAQAKNVCRRCPAIRACLEWALTHAEYGVWAATTEQERADLVNRHRRTA